MAASGQPGTHWRRREAGEWGRPRPRPRPRRRRGQGIATAVRRAAASGSPTNVAHFGGSWPFIFTFLGLIFAWMVLNTVFLARVLDHKQFDPYPCIALNLMLSALAGLQAPIIMMSQNRAAARDEALAAHH